MKKLALLLGIFLVISPVYAQEKNIRRTLDKVAETFDRAGGVKAEFTVNVLNRVQQLGRTRGEIHIKGDKFLLTTPDAITWFDGTTQWSYLIDSDEVNVSNPTPEELQSINPYTLLSLYRTGYNYSMGSATAFQGAEVKDIILTAKDDKQEHSCIELYIKDKAFYPLYIVVEQRDGTKSEIMIEEFETGLKYEDSMFVFDQKKYPTAEIIDLR